MGKYLVNLTADPKSNIDGAWMPVSADTHRDAAIEAFKICVNLKTTINLGSGSTARLWARVHGEKDAKHPSGSPALVHTFEMEIRLEGGTEHDSPEQTGS